MRDERNGYVSQCGGEVAVDGGEERRKAQSMRKCKDRSTKTMK